MGKLSKVYNCVILDMYIYIYIYYAICIAQKILQVKNYRFRVFF